MLTSANSSAPAGLAFVSTASLCAFAPNPHSNPSGKRAFMSDTANPGLKQSFQLKSASVSLTALELYYFDNDEFEANLRDKISQAPGFFKDIPLVISLDKYEGLDSELDFFKIIGTCRRHNIHVMGVRAGNDDQRRLARGASLALFPSSSVREQAPASAQSEENVAPDIETASPAAPTAIEPAPARSEE